jgi:hypothetical protein
MTFYQLSFIKQIRLIFIAACTILIINLIFNDLNDINNSNMKIGKIELPPFPNNVRIKKFDVSRGEDFWILTDVNEVMYYLNDYVII